jgi:phosphatidylglycerol---prolipoprotein diacylglyceryl transferase
LSGIARFILEFVRVNPPLLFGLSQAQVISVCLIVVSAVMLLVRREEHPAVVTPSLHLAREKRR